jgi:hypothetical protein
MTEAEWEAGGDPAALLSFLGQRAGPRKRRLFACACARRIRHLLKSTASEQAIDAAEQYADGLLTDEELAGFEQAARQASARAVREAHSVWALGPAALTARAAWVSVWAACAAENTCDRFSPEGVAPGTLETGFQGCLAIRTAQVASWARSVAEELSEVHGSDMPDTETALFFSFLRGLKTTVQRIEQAVRDGLETCETVWQARLVREIFGNPFRVRQFDPAWRHAQGGAVLNIATAIYQERTWAEMPILADALEDAGCDDRVLLDHLHSPAPHVRGCWVLDLILGRE